MDLGAIRIASFDLTDQEPLRELILAGLAEHWGNLDSSLNPDLDDIAATYAGATVLVAWLDRRIVGTGTLVLRSPEVGEIVRMSVAADLRRRGIGMLVLAALRRRAGVLGLRRIVLETAAHWGEVIAFYEAAGFHVTHYEDSPFGREAHFSLALE
jgi:GNAT superfamily N-acetyltransferase